MGFPLSLEGASSPALVIIPSQLTARSLLWSLWEHSSHGNQSHIPSILRASKAFLQDPPPFKVLFSKGRVAHSMVKC